MHTSLSSDPELVMHHHLQGEVSAYWYIILTVLVVTCLVEKEIKPHMFAIRPTKVTPSSTAM